MLWNVYVLFDDKKRSGNYPRTFYKEDGELFEKLNKDWRGVYCSVNDFDATPEQMHLKWVKTKRNIPFLENIRGLYSDFDIAKSWDWQTIEEKEEKKQKLLKKVCEFCEPSIVIWTSNWLQPMRVLDNTEITEQYQKRYIKTLEWIIAWSETVWSSGDKVKDITRILRVPGYYHMKQEPFMCEMIYWEGKKYTLEEMENIFKDYIPKEEKKVKKIYNTDNQTKQFQEIDRLDFEDVVIKAFQSVGRSCEFDKQKRLKIDGRLTGTFQGKHWDRRYLASTSHEPFEWNLITSVADIQSTNNKEAYKRILKTFNIESETELQNKIYIPEVEKLKIPEWFIFPSNVFDEMWCLQTGELVTIVAEWHSWKTTFALDMIQANAKRWKKGFYMNLEFPIRTMREWRRLFINWKKKKNLNDIDPMNDIDRNKMERYIEKKLDQFDHLDHPWWIELDNLIKQIIEKSQDWYKLIVIDSFSKIDIEWKEEYSVQKSIMLRLQKLVQKLQITIVLLHHTNKSWDFAGTKKIFDDSNVFITISKDEDWDMEEFRVFTLSKDKITTTTKLNIYFVNHEYTAEKDYKPNNVF